MSDLRLRNRVPPILATIQLMRFKFFGHLCRSQGESWLLVKCCALGRLMVDGVTDIIALETSNAAYIEKDVWLEQTFSWAAETLKMSRQSFFDAASCRDTSEYRRDKFAYKDHIYSMFIRCCLEDWTSGSDNPTVETMLIIKGHMCIRYDVHSRIDGVIAMMKDDEPCVELSRCAKDALRTSKISRAKKLKSVLSDNEICREVRPGSWECVLCDCVYTTSQQSMARHIHRHRTSDLPTVVFRYQYQGSSNEGRIEYRNSEHVWSPRRGEHYSGSKCVIDRVIDLDSWKKNNALVCPRCDYLVVSLKRAGDSLSSLGRKIKQAEKHWYRCIAES